MPGPPPRPKNLHTESAVEPNCIWFAPEKPLPVTKTEDPPLLGPVFGLTTLTAGAGVGTQVNWSALDAALVPPAVVTRTSTVVPAGPAGLTASMRLSSNGKKPPLPNTLVTVVDPKLTPVTPDRPVPVMKTAVRPAAGPLAGATAVTVGTGAGV